MSRYRLMISQARRERRALLVIIGLTLVTSLVVALQPWPLKLLADYALGDAPRPDWLPGSWSVGRLVLFAGLASLALFALNSGLDAAITRTWTRAGRGLMFRLAGDVFQRLLRSRPTIHAARPVGDALSRAVDDSWCVYFITEGLLISPLQRLLTIFMVGAFAWQLDRQLAVLTFLAAPVLGWATWYFGGRLRARAREHRKLNAQLSSFVQQTLTAIPLVQAFGSETRNRERFDQLADSAVELNQRGALLRNLMLLVNGLTTTAGTALVLVVGGRRIMAGGLSIGSLLVFLAYLQSLQNAARGLLGTYASLKTSEARLDRVQEVFAADDILPEPANPRRLPPETTGISVEIDQVTAGYVANRPVLHAVSLAASPGEVVAIVGATGAGKTTLASLVPRFLDPWQGTVRFNGVDLRKLALDDVRARIAMVLQEPFLLPRTVAANIAYGRVDATDDDIRAAAVAAQADEFIRALPRGYETVIGERGATLSGGQRQRLSIARALLKNAPVLILDEPTAALDAGTETDLLAALERLIEGRTTIVIAHRLSTVREANRIVVLDAGEIVETGTHATLLAQDGIYRQLHDRQWLSTRGEPKS